MIAFCKPTIGEEEIEACNRVDRSGWLAAGPETRAFEEEFAAYVGVKHAIFTASCTAALKMAYKWAEEDQYYEYLYYPRNTFCATYSAAEEMGLQAISYNLGERPPDLAGFRVNTHYGSVLDPTPCLIEDSAHRIEPNDFLIGNIRCYSFYATKNMTTRTGGMFVTNDDAIYETARLYWRDGLTTSTEDRMLGVQGYAVRAMAGGYDNNDNAAAMGRIQLRKLPTFTERRNDIVRRYNAGLGQEWTGNHLYPYMLEREDQVYPFIEAMRKEGVACSYHYPGTGWKGVSLPLYPTLTDDEVVHIIRSVQACDPRNLHGPSPVTS